MRNEAVDCSEIARRIELGIYDKEEFERAMAWVEKHCKTHEGEDLNPEHLRYSREKKDEVWEYVVKMTMIFRDLMVGNPKLAERASKRRPPGHQCHRRRFQGPAPVDRLPPRRRLLRGHSQHVVRLERHPRSLHLRHRKRHAERRFDALHAPADQSGTAFLRRTHLLEPRSRRARHGQETDGQGRERHHPPDQLGKQHAGRFGARCPTPRATP